MSWKEECSCGAKIELNYENDKQEARALAWRKDHHHPAPAAPVEPFVPQHEHRDNGSTVEARWHPDVGFHPLE